MKRASFILASWLCLAGAASGCIDTFGDDDGYGVTPEPEGSMTAALRVAHLSPGAADVDVWLNGTGPAYQRVGYAKGTDYLDLAAGAYDLEVTTSGSNASTALTSVDALSLFATTSNTAVIYGPPGSLEVLTLEDDLSPVSAGAARLRLSHLASGFASVDVYDLTGPGPGLLLEDNLGYGMAGEAFELPVVDAPAPTLVVGIDVDEDTTPDATFELSGLADGSIANLYAVTDASGELSLLRQLADGSIDEVGGVQGPGPAEIRAIHLSPDAPALNVEVLGPQTAVATDLELGKSSPYASIPSGEQILQLTTAADPSKSLFELDAMDLLPGARYTVAAFGNFDGIEGLTLVEPTAEGNEPGTFRVRTIHTAPALGQIDVWDLTDLGNPILLDQNISYGDVGELVSLATGASYVIGLDANGDDAAEAYFQLPDMPEGEVANLFATSQGPDTVSLFSLLSSGDVITVEGTSVAP
jgi:hypothetical protein